MDFVDENLGYFYESGNSPQKLYKTTNGGLNWNETNFTKFPMILKFYDMNFGLIYSPNFADSTKEINRTTDGGLTWESFTVSMTGWGNDIEFVRGDPSKVWFTDWLGLYFSSDSGKTWTEEKLSDSELKGRDIVFTDDNSGWLICDNGKIYRTTNTEPGVTALETEKVIGSSYKLMQNYPNPFNPETTINYQLPFSSYVTLKVYDALGKEITTLVNEFKTAGEYQIKFRSSISSGISSGVYFYRLKTNDFIEIKKMLLLK
ncbi:MAG: T9SS type A sorting domain-containing protein [Bacteroidetes bacterium]|nr:T9SS type A sorting domain-containing protein [Bacteroidota bacterium]